MIFCTEILATSLVTLMSTSSEISDMVSETDPDMTNPSKEFSSNSERAACNADSEATPDMSGALAKAMNFLSPAVQSKFRNVPLPDA